MKRILFVSIGLMLLLGCGGKPNPKGSVSGTVHYKGKPVNGAMLRLHPTSGEGNDIPIPVSQEGTFSAADIPPGEYKIVVESQDFPQEQMKMPPIPKGMDPAKAAEMKEKFQQAKGGEVPTIPYPDKYKKEETTDLKYTINPGKQALTLQLKD
jgi:hypothetical protein